MKSIENEEVVKFDKLRPFGLTTGETRFVMALSPDVKWRTKDAVKIAYVTLLYDDLQRSLATLKWKSGQGVFILD